MHYRLILILLFWLLPLASAGHAEPLVLEEGTQSLSLAGHLYWYRDADGGQSLEQIIQRDQAGQFTHDIDFPSFGYTDDVIWVRFAVLSDNLRHSRWLLSIAPSFLDHVQLFQITDNGVLDLGTQGDRETWDHRDVPWRHSVYELELPTGQQINHQPSIFYLRIHSTSSIAVNAVIRETSDVISNAGKKMLLFGMLLAAGVMTAALSLLFFFLLRQRIYLYFMLYTLSVTFMAVQIEGVIHFIIQPTTPLHLEWLQIICQAIAAVSMTLMLCEIIDLKALHPRLYRAVLWISSSLAITACIPFMLGFYGLSISFLWACIALLCTAIPLIVFQQRHRLGYIAWLYIGSFAVLGASVLIRLSWVFGFLAQNKLYENFFPLVIILHILIVFLTMAVNYIQLNQRMRAATNEALVSIERSEKNLRALVVQRTEELDAANQHLATQLTLSKQNATILEKARHRLGAALDTEKKSSLNQRQFLRMVAHEFRTPLSVIQMATDIISNDPRTPDVHAKTNCERIQQASIRMASIINQALQEDRLDNAEWRKNSAFIQVLELLTDGKQYGEMASGGRHKIELNCSKNLVIQGDRDLLLTMINNIIDNAVKYCPADSIIELSGEKKADDTVSITIRDHGPGMNEEDLQQVLDKYFRTGSENVPGMGLGLYLVDRIVRLHNATLKIESPTDGGLSFTVVFPSLIVTEEHN